jgi:hypothetical protein
VEVGISAKLIGLFPLIVVPTSAAGVRNASVGAGGHLVAKSWNVQKAGGTISQQAAVHSWLAANAQQQQQQQQYYGILV